METATTKSKIETAMADETMTLVLLGGEGCGSINVEGLAKVFGGQQHPLTRTNCIELLKDLTEEELVRLPVRIAQVPNNIKYDIQLVNSTEQIVLHADNMIELKPKPALDLLRYCCSDPYPMQGPNSTLICARCSMTFKIVQ